jgi:hypothetical protein
VPVFTANWPDGSQLFQGFVFSDDPAEVSRAHELLEEFYARLTS